MLSPTKLNHRLLSAWLDSDLAKSDNCHLVFVGENHAGAYGKDLLSVIKRHPQGSSVHVTGWVDQKPFESTSSLPILAYNCERSREEKLLLPYSTA